VDVLGASAYVPGEQGVSSAAPVEQKEPAAQMMQSSALIIVAFSVAFLRVPAGHGSGADAPSAQ